MERRRIPEPPDQSASIERWRQWVDEHYPYDPSLDPRRLATSSIRLDDQLDALRACDDRIIAAYSARTQVCLDRRSPNGTLAQQQRTREHDEQLCRERRMFINATLEGQHGHEAREVAERMLRGKQWTDERLTRVMAAVNTARNAKPMRSGMCAK
jgi:hypothetical protein